MELEAAKMIGAGLAAIALAGAGVGIGIILEIICRELCVILLQHKNNFQIYYWVLLWQKLLDYLV